MIEFKTEINNKDKPSDVKKSKKVVLPKQSKKVKNYNIMEMRSMNQKVNDYFSRFYFIKLKELGEDHVIYGNMNLFGRSYAPIEINVDYIMKRAKKKELSKIKNKTKIFFEKFNIDDNYSEFNFNQANQLINKFRYSKISLPLIKTKNKNKSMENLPFQKKDINTNTDILNEKENSNNSSFNEEKKNDGIMTNINNINQIKKGLNEKNKNYIKRNKNKNNKNIIIRDEIPKLKNKIFITNRNLKLYIQTDKTEIKTENNKRNHILKRNEFLRRLDKTEGLKKRLTELNDGLIRLNKNISKVVFKSDEDNPQFNLRFKHLINKTKHSPNF